MKKKVLLDGFSLIEVSISLLIMGIISSIFISQMNSVSKFNVNQKTQANIDFVIRAIGAHFINSDYRIPYPSSEKKNIGIADESMAGSFGIVPFKTLGIMEKFAKNGNGKWLLYKINPFFGIDGLTDSSKIKLGINEFESNIRNDKVAIIIKSVNSKDETEYTVWYGEKSFAANYGNNMAPKQLKNVDSKASKITEASQENPSLKSTNTKKKESAQRVVIETANNKEEDYM